MVYLTLRINESYEGIGEGMYSGAHELLVHLCVATDEWDEQANREAFATMITEKRAKENAEEKKKAKDDQVQPFEQIDFGILRSRRMVGSAEDSVIDDMDLINASNSTH